jgi:TfoX/Sxy family transcriptional regulator of competence genes
MTPQTNLPKGIWGGKTALFLGGLFLALFALNTLLVRWDAADRSRLETLTPAPLEASR